MKKLVLILTFMPSKPFRCLFYSVVSALCFRPLSPWISDFQEREDFFFLLTCLSVGPFFLTSAYPVGYRFFFANSRVPFMSVKAKESCGNLFGIPILSVKWEGCRKEFRNDNTLVWYFAKTRKGTKFAK